MGCTKRPAPVVHHVLHHICCTTSAAHFRLHNMYCNARVAPQWLVHMSYTTKMVPATVHNIDCAPFVGKHTLHLADGITCPRETHDVQV
eukprot:5831916-Pyramimonas_sp.AAC.1